MKPRAFFLVPCSSSSSSSSSFPQEIVPADGGARTTNRNDGEGGGGGDPIVSRPPKKKKKKRGVIIPKPKIGFKHCASSSSLSSSSSSSSSATRVKQWGPPKGDGVQDLALPLGMSFAAVVSQILDGINGSRRQIPIDLLSLICTSAVKESVANIYGDRFDCFLLNFEKSFGSTLRTLQLINEASVVGYRNRSSHVPNDEQGNQTVNEPSIVEPGNSNCSSVLSSSSCGAAQGNCEVLGAAVEKSVDIPPLTTMNNQIEESEDIPPLTLQLINEASVVGYRNKSSHVPNDEQGNRTVNEPSIVEPGNSNCSSFLSSSSCGAVQGNCEVLGAAVEKSEDIPPLTTMNNQIVIHGQMNRELASVSHSFTGQSILSTFEKSVLEQTRSNDLKAFEIGLIRRKLELKESQLAISSYANVLDKIKISMGISKASFKEEKLRNQMLDARHAELLRRCIDLLVAGLIIMSCCLSYGTYIFSYERITEATSACSATPKESKSWWIPKPVASFSSGWLMLRCHVVAMTRMFFGFAMIAAIAYFAFQRSAMSTPTPMPVTILLLGFLCGIAGMLCLDTLGGGGFHWLLYWGAFCLVHFLANIFPSVLYQLLYGPISLSPVMAEGRQVPYWFRRFMFNLILSIIYPALCGLLPFASLGDWKEHFSEKIYHLFYGVEIQE